MRLSVDIWIDPERDRGDDAELSGEAINAVEFAADFDIKTANPRSQRGQNLVLAFADASTRFISPTDTISKPDPKRANTLSTARLEFALTA